MDKKAIREEYIQSRSSQALQDVAKSVVSMINGFEKKHGVEFETMSRDTVISMLNSQKYANLSSARKAVQGLRTFIDWCGGLGAKFCCDINSISYRDLDLATACSENYYKNFQSIIHLLRMVGDPSDGLAIFPFAVFAWMGVDIHEAPDLVDADINFATKTVNCKSALTHPTMDENMIDILKEYAGVRSVTKENRITMVPDRCGRFVYRLAYKNQVSDRDVAGRMTPSQVFQDASRKLARNGINRNVTYSNIAKSGALYKIHQLEKSGLDLTSKPGKEALQTYIGSPKAYPGDAMLLYQAYKKAFNLK